MSFVLRWFKLSMSCIKRWFKYLTFQGPLKPIKFPTSGFQVIDESEYIGEEGFEDFNPDEWYPVNVGDVYHDRYQVIGKLGFGTTSTVWLGRHLQTREFVALKVYTAGDWHLNEAANMEDIAEIDPSHPGYAYVRHLIEIMWLKKEDGRMHFVLVMQPMWQSWQFLLDTRCPNGKFPVELLKPGLRCLFKGLEYLHDECRLVHTDIKADNVLHGIKDQRLFQRYVDGELAVPSPRKFIGDYTVYASTGFVDPRKGKWGEPVLCDLGAAVPGDGRHNELAQPHYFRAPEVIMGADWSYPIDIWNVGALIWYLFQDDILFHGREEIGLTDRALMADIVSVLGTPPLDLIAKAEGGGDYFAPDGRWIADVPMPPSKRLEDCVTNLEGEDKEGFMNLVRGMLQWRPEDRKTAKELINEPWLNSP